MSADGFLASQPGGQFRPVDEIGEELRHCDRGLRPRFHQIINGEQHEEPRSVVVRVPIERIGQRDHRRTHITQATDHSGPEFDTIVAHVAVLSFRIGWLGGLRGRRALGVGMLPVCT